MAEIKNADEVLDVLVIGAGFAGLHTLHEMRRLGLRARVIEAGSDVGGAWYWNRYPGARCDVESLVYCYSFSPEVDEGWRWSERYSSQPEIQAYIRYVSEQLDLRRDISFNTRVTRARFDEATDTWGFETDIGETVHARFCVMATGPITVPILPNIPGIKDFRGESYHTADWPRENPSFAGKRVGVIGTGSSGTQLIPVVAKEAERLYVFSRTPNYTVPARNSPLDGATYEKWLNCRESVRQAVRRGDKSGAGDVFMEEELRKTRATRALSYTKEERERIMQRRWDIGGAVIQGCFADVMTDEDVNLELSDFVKAKIGEIVKDPAVADKLTPKDLPIGTKRICVDTGYYETFNRDNVEVVDVKADPIECVTENSVVTKSENVELDVLIYATGFDALTGALTAIDIRGCRDRSLSDVWGDGPHTFVGMMIAGFPNMFLVGGPGSPSVLSNVVMTNEFQVEFIRDLIDDTVKKGLTRVDVSNQSQEAWTQQVNEIVTHTLLSKANSWYVGANVPGKPRAILAYTGGVARYNAAVNLLRDNGFQDFERSSVHDAVANNNSRVA